MKLPEDPKERNQIFVLIGILGAGALYGFFQLANVLLIKPHKENVAQIADLSEKISDADADVEMMPILKENNAQHIGEITDISDKYILHPNLGSYLLPAKKIVEKLAKDIDVRVIEINEIGINEFPPPEPPAPVKDSSGHAKPVAAPKRDYAFKIYTARVEVDNGLHDFIKLVKAIEQANPYICISAMTLASQEETPFKHSMTFDVQWPIWNPNKSTEKLLQQLNSPTFRQSLAAPAPAKKAEPKKKEDKSAKPADTVSVDEGKAEVNDKLKDLGVQLK